MEMITHQAIAQNNDVDFLKTYCYVIRPRDKFTIIRENYIFLQALRTHMIVLFHIYLARLYLSATHQRADDASQISSFVYHPQQHTLEFFVTFFSFL